MRKMFRSGWCNGGGFLHVIVVVVPVSVQFILLRRILIQIYVYKIIDFFVVLLSIVQL